MRRFIVQLELLIKRKSFLLTLSIMSIYSIAVFVINCVTFYNNDIVTVKAAQYLYLGSDFLDLPFVIYSLVFPIISTIPFSDSFFEERKNNTLEFCIMRESNIVYYFSKLFAVFFSGFIVTATPLLINMLLNFIAFPLDSYIDATNFTYVRSHLFEDVMETGLFSDLFARNMYLYNLLYLFLGSFVSGLISVIVYQFSFFYKESRILLLCSFFAVYHFITIILNVIDANEFCVNNYIFASMFYSGQTVRGMVVTFILIGIAAILPIPFSLKRLNKNYE